MNVAPGTMPDVLVVAQPHVVIVLKIGHDLCLHTYVPVHSIHLTV